MSAPIDALINACGFRPDEAAAILTNLERVGMTIYKKKVCKNGRRPASSQPLTPKVAAAIRRYFHTYPEATQQEIANAFNVNIGRVNEALEGK